jgi:pimeloyl-ACP methyl ester carboxylesterase
MRPAHPTLTAALALAAVAPAAARLAAPNGPAFLAECAVEGLEGPAWCGRYAVWEDRAAAAGRKIDLNVLVLPATGEEALPDPVVYIAGGPGDSSVAAAAGLASFLAPLRERRDIFLLDLRGTGRSAPLRCPYQDAPERPLEYLNDVFPRAGAEACARELGARADLRFYTTPFAVDDLDEVRRALGYTQLNLFGASYGTRASLVYAQRHPESVRTLALLGPVPTDARMPLELAAATEAALRGHLEDCAADPACHAAFPDPAGDLAQALARLDAAPAVVDVALGGTTVSVRLTRAGFVQAVRYLLYATPSVPQVPLFLHQAAAGDFHPVASWAAGIGEGFNGMPDGAYLAVTCTEDVPFFSLEEARSSAAGTMIGMIRADAQKAACGAWPRGELPEGYFEPVTVPVPTLLVVGQFDPASPPSWARRIAERLPDALLVEVPDGAHDTTGMPGGECLDAMFLRVVEQGSTAGLDAAACLASIHRPPFLTAIEEPIELPAEALAAFAGTYRSEKGPTLVVTLTDGRLVASVGANRSVLVPVAASRFLFQGLPPSFALEFDRSGDAVTAARLYQGGEPMVFVRE